MLKNLRQHNAWQLLFAVGCVMLFGCEMLKDLDTEKENENPFALDRVTDEERNGWYKDANSIESSPLLSNRPAVETNRPASEVGTMQGVRKPEPISHEVTDEARKTLKANLPPAITDEEIMADFNFKNASMTDVLPVFSELLGVSYAVEGTLPGSVTMSMHEKISRRKLWEVFQQLLRLSGVVGDYNGNLLHLRAANAIPQELTMDAMINGSLELGVFRLQNSSPAEVAAEIRKFLPRDLRAIELPRQNTLLVLDTQEGVTRIGALIEELDRPANVNLHRSLFVCNNVRPEQVVKELKELLPLLGFPVATNAAERTAGQIAITAFPRFHAVAVAAANREAVDEVAKWFRILDQVDDQQEQLFIYEVQHGRAEVLAKALATMFNVTGTGVEANGNDGFKENTNMNSSATLPSNEESAPGTVFTVPIRVWSDSLNQRLSIRTTPRAFASVKAFLERIDTIPPQVLLQVLVIEINLSDSVEFGIEFMQQGTVGNWDIEGGTDYKYLAPGGEQYGGKMAIYDPEDPEKKYAYVNALAGQSNVRVISNPQILIVSDNEAKINVGDDVPIISAEITDTASTSTYGTSLVRNVTYKQTGINLTVKPRITRGGRIDMDVRQEISEAQNNTTSNIDSPQVQTRSVNTTMSLKNGQLLVCGGLIREKVQDNLDSIPFLVNIPFLRRLVGDTNISTSRTEMLVLITGTIITEDTELQKLIKDYRHSVDSLVEFAKPESGQQKTRFKHSGDLDKWFLE